MVDDKLSLTESTKWSTGNWSIFENSRLSTKPMTEYFPVSNLNSVFQKSKQQSPKW